MRSDVVKALADRRASVGLACRERRQAAEDRSARVREDARQGMASLAGMNRERRSAVSERLGDLRVQRSERAAERHRVLSGFRAELSGLVDTRLTSLREESALCKAYWSAEGNA